MIGVSGSKRSLVGKVVSDKMEKTVSVSVERRILHQQFKKYVNRAKKYLAHDEKGEAKMGDVVEIVESRPLSKRKSWKLVRVVQKESGANL